ncbi:hypothetical protein BJ742DRAFT_789662 [Cladochytrium replicatum]|nr:hypothetical protein BJ742DRAFT_789662 [Cladochytrium replicatum]
MGNTLDTLRTHRRRGSGSSRRYAPDSDGTSATKVNSSHSTSPAPSKASSGSSGGDGMFSPIPPHKDPLLRYFQPSAAKEVSDGCRFTMQQHVLLKKVYRTNFMGISEHALQSGIRVLDGCAATGIWISEMEQEFPESQFFGLDLTFGVWSDTQLMFGNKRTRIVETDSFSRIPFKPNVFDYVHEQANLFITPEVEWPQTIREFTRVLKPGGILDLVEVDPIPSFDPNADIPPFLVHTLAAQAAIGFGGVDWRVASKVAQYVEASNAYTDIQVIRRTIPIGWDGELGQLCRIHMEGAQVAIMPVLAAAMNNGTPSNASPEDFSQFSGAFFDACGQSLAYILTFRVTARKKYQE